MPNNSTYTSSIKNFIQHFNPLVQNCSNQSNAYPKCMETKGNTYTFPLTGNERSLTIDESLNVHYRNGNETLAIPIFVEVSHKHEKDRVTKLDVTKQMVAALSELDALLNLKPLTLNNGKQNFAVKNSTFGENPEIEQADGGGRTRTHSSIGSLINDLGPKSGLKVDTGAEINYYLAPSKYFDEHVHVNPFIGTVYKKDEQGKFCHLSSLPVVLGHELMHRLGHNTDDSIKELDMTPNQANFTSKEEERVINSINVYADLMGNEPRTAHDDLQERKILTTVELDKLTPLYGKLLNCNDNEVTAIFSPDKGLDKGAKIGIGVGAGVAGSAALFAVLWHLSKRKSSSLEQDNV